MVMQISGKMESKLVICQTIFSSSAIDLIVVIKPVYHLRAANPLI